jgi:hypothetical protein
MLTILKQLPKSNALYNDQSHPHSGNPAVSEKVAKLAKCLTPVKQEEDHWRSVKSLWADVQSPAEARQICVFVAGSELTSISGSSARAAARRKEE